MKVRKVVFVIAGVALLSVGALFSLNHHQGDASAPAKIADGTRPMPPFPPFVNASYSA